MSLLWHVQNPLVVFFSNPISIIPEPFWLCSKYGVLYPTYHKMLSCWHCTGHSQGGGLGHCKMKEIFPDFLHHSVFFHGLCLVGSSPRFQVFNATVPVMAYLLYKTFDLRFFSPLCSICFPHLRALLPFARQG